MSLLSDRFTTQLSMWAVAERYGIKFDRTGFTICPFHADSSPSCMLYKEKGRGYYCFSCNTGGSVIDFVQRYFKLTYINALKKLDEDFNLHILDVPLDRTTSRVITGNQSLNKIRNNFKKKSLESMIKLHCKYHLSIKHDEPMSDSFCEALYNITDLDYRINETEV